MLGRQVGPLGQIQGIFKSPLSIYDHINATGYSIKLDNFSIIERESQDFTRTTKEAILVESMTLPLTGAWASINCHIFGMKCYRTDMPALHLQWYTLHIFPSFVTHGPTHEGEHAHYIGKNGPPRGAFPQLSLFIMASNFPP